MPEHAGRPKQNIDDTVVMTLRFPKDYYAELTTLATECGIRSTNSYSTFMLISHCNMMRQAKRAATEADA